jgi:hypothetical protein
MGKLSLLVPEVGAMENLKSEMLINAKAISAVTGIPIHWLGHVDAMSNRSTADSLYETINNAVDEIVDTLSNDEEKKMAFWEVEEDLSLRPLNDCALRSSPTLKKSVPKDATEKQNLTKYNNPETVYRNSKGRFAKLN